MPDRIRVESIFHRGSADESRPWILEDVSFSIAPGELLTVIGPSGAGKTTLLRLLAYLETPARGNILLDGQPLDEIDLPELRGRVGMVFQIPALFDSTVADNVLYGPRLRGDAGPAAAGEVLDLVGLERGLLGESAKCLSVGQQQRVALARAMILRPEVLLVDEPTAALDPASAARIFRLIRDLNRETGLTVVQVTHDVGLARQCGGRVLLLVNGKKVEEGGCGSFFAEAKTEVGRAFIEGRLE